MNSPANNLVLRYFDCIGRVQGLRDFLHDRGIEFCDERIPKIEAVDGSWTQRQARSPETLNAFQALPLLEGKQLRVEQTEAIALYLTLACEVIPVSDQARLVKHSSVFSFSHQDLMLPMALFLWTPVFHPSKDLKAATQQNADLLAHRLRAVNLMVDAAEGQFLFGDQPSIADFGLFEACLGAQQLFGDRVKVLSPAAQGWPDPRADPAKGPAQLGATSHRHQWQPDRR